MAELETIELMVMTHKGSRELKNDAAIAAAVLGKEDDYRMVIAKDVIYGAFMKTVKDASGKEFRVLEITTRSGHKLYTREENASKFFEDWTGSKLESEV